MQKLEPWSVSKVKVAGSLNILSALAKGLPVSEDHDVITDVEHLKAVCPEETTCNVGWSFFFRK